MLECGWRLCGVTSPWRRARRSFKRVRPRQSAAIQTKLLRDLFFCKGGCGTECEITGTVSRLSKLRDSNSTHLGKSRWMIWKIGSFSFGSRGWTCLLTAGWSTSFGRGGSFTPAGIFDTGNDESKFTRAIVSFEICALRDWLHFFLANLHRSQDIAVSC